MIRYSFYNCLNSVSSTDIGLNKTISGNFRRNRPGGSDYVSTTSNQTVNYGFANASGATCNQNSLALEFSCFRSWVFALHQPFLNSSAAQLAAVAAAAP